ncbi:MAG: hypothetical protein A2Z06_04815 [Candidatus Glassbacteria bacterium RBG_16_58_8]|uniref:Lipopolysaccharide export system permease protein LptF n=1 Tax=Candidatus Glassbacteria bacterium RBG_16_58_8 TaxID=1817866 RepID=A0A1F5YC22_9BACT|nr:MAG: hypothetical protein A2Z06_04815 [Candidatus Glassbacteria bacterium RBG_16_58_8]
MKTLHRYILREHAGPLAFSLVILLSIFLMNQVVLLFDKIVGKGLHWSVILEVFGLCIPFILATAMPMAVLMSTLWAFGRLSSDNEIMAMKASGINLPAIILPLLLASLLLTLVMAWFNNTILPDSNYRLRSILLDISYQKPAIEIKEGILMDDLSGYSLLVQRIDRHNSRLYDITIYDNSSEGAPRTIVAEEGELSFSENRRDLILRLEDGEIHLVDPENLRNYQRVAFRTQTIVIKDVGGEFQKREHGRYRTDREMSSRMMMAEVNDNRARIAVIRAQVDELMRSGIDTLSLGPTLPQMPVISRGKGMPLSQPVEGAGQRARRAFLEIQKKQWETEALQKRINQLMVEVHKKYAIPFASVVFVLLGAPLRLNFRSGGAGTVIVLSILTFLSYYVFLTGGENLGDRGLIDPFAAMWAPNIFFGLLGIALLWKSTRETSSLTLTILNPLTWFRRRKGTRPIESP